MFSSPSLSLRFQLQTLLLSLRFQLSHARNSAESYSLSRASLLRFHSPAASSTADGLPSPKGHCSDQTPHGPDKSKLGQRGPSAKTLLPVAVQPARELTHALKLAPFSMTASGSPQSLCFLLWVAASAYSNGVRGVSAGGQVRLLPAVAADVPDQEA